MAPRPACIWLALLAAPSAWAARISGEKLWQAAKEEVAHPQLCAPEIVAATCKLFGSETNDVSVAELQKVLAADEESVPSAWTELGLTAEQRISCSDLCTGAVRLLGQEYELPPSSDLACRHVDGKLVCDIDLSPHALESLVPKDLELPDLHDEVSEPRAPNKGRKQRVKPGLVARKETIDYELSELLRRVANLFRIYPTPSAEFVHSNPRPGQEEALLQEGQASGRRCSANCSTLDDICAKHSSYCGDCPACQRLERVWYDPTSWFGPSDEEIEKTWRAEVEKRNIQAQAYVNNALMKFKAGKAQKLTKKWFGAAAVTDQHLSVEISRVLNSIVRMLGSVSYVYPGDQCSPNTYAYVYPRGYWAKDTHGKYVFHLCKLYMTSKVSVQIETLTHEGSHHATAYTDDVCMDEYAAFGSTDKPNYIEVPFREFGWRGKPELSDSLDWRLSNGRQVPAVVRLLKSDVAVLQLEPEKDCKNKAYGRGSCATLASKDSVKAVRNADNVCYWIQDVADS